MTAERRRPCKIGSLEIANPLFLAPLSGISDLPFRLLAKEQGCGLVCTEMVSAEGLIRSRKRTERFLRSCPQERPLAVQIFGSRPDSMAEAARIIEELGVALVDINMGCPVRKVVSGGAGAALLKDLGRAEAIISSVRKALSIPLTVKIRLGWDEKSLNFLETARVAQDAGADALTVHGRTRSQTYGDKADWEAIAQVKASLKIPVIGNGDLNSARAVADFFARTNCDGAMIGRGAYGNPWIFRQSLRLLRGEAPGEISLNEREETILRHWRMLVEDRGEELSWREFRKHLIWYTRGFNHSAGFRAAIPEWQSPAQMIERIQEFFRELREAGPA